MKPYVIFDSIDLAGITDAEPKSFATIILALVIDPIDGKQVVIRSYPEESYAFDELQDEFSDCEEVMTLYHTRVHKTSEEVRVMITRRRGDISKEGLLVEVIGDYFSHMRVTSHVT